MSDPQDPLLAEHLEAALEASCAALVELQLLRSLAGDDDRLVAPTTCAIAALRGAIDDLRAAQPGDASPLASGFVLERDHEAPPVHPSQEVIGRRQRSRRLIERARMTLATGRHRSEGKVARSGLLLPNTPGPLGKG